jgi:hypothetical protein
MTDVRADASPVWADLLKRTSVHLFRSRAAARIRQFVTPRPKTSLPLFPLAYPVVRIADSLFNDMHGQIVIVTAVRCIVRLSQFIAKPDCPSLIVQVLFVEG